MKSGGKNPAKELYQRLRTLPWEELWNNEVPRFDRATPRERFERVAVIRAVGVVFSESGPAGEKAKVVSWLRNLLRDPEEKIRRYAMAAIPKIGASADDEAELLSLATATASERERKHLSQTLGRIGGVATLKAIKRGAGALLPQMRQKVEASVARAERPGTIRMDALLSDVAELRVHLRGRRGLEQFVREEVEQCPRTQKKFRVVQVSNGLVVLRPEAAFSAGDIYALRCFSSAGFVLGEVSCPSNARMIEALAQAITSPTAQRIFKTFTDGSMRYRLEFIGKGHQRAAVRAVANAAYARCPEILNDARSATWSVNIHPAGRMASLVELLPKFSPDPRYNYRRRDVPAASHPPLAACMARLAGRANDEIVWDPFCGSGLELIERALLGGVKKLICSDRSADAIVIARENFESAKMRALSAQFACCDFRDYAMIEGMGANIATLIITNPPMGRRVPIRDLRGLIEDLFSVAATVLKPGGRLVLANPVSIIPPPALRLQFRQVIDLGGFDVRLEKYVKR